MKHTISVLVENKFGVLARISGLFSSRGFNIDSLTVGATDDPEIARMTIIVKGDDRILEQVTKQLHKLIDVIKVSDLTNEERIERELILIKVSSEGRRAEIIEIANIFRAKIVDVAPKSVIIEMTGDDEKIKALVELLKPFGIKELVRTGKIAILRGS